MANSLLNTLLTNGKTLAQIAGRTLLHKTSELQREITTRCNKAICLVGTEENMLEIIHNRFEDLNNYREVCVCSVNDDVKVDLELYLINTELPSTSLQSTPSNVDRVNCYSNVDTVNVNSSLANVPQITPSRHHDIQITEHGNSFLANVAQTNKVNLKILNIEFSTTCSLQLANFAKECSTRKVDINKLNLEILHLMMASGDATISTYSNACKANRTDVSNVFDNNINMNSVVKIKKKEGTSDLINKPISESKHLDCFRTVVTSCTLQNIRQNEYNQTSSTFKDTNKTEAKHISRMDTNTNINLHTIITQVQVQNHSNENLLACNKQGNCHFDLTCEKDLNKDTYKQSKKHNCQLPYNYNSTIKQDPDFSNSWDGKDVHSQKDIHNKNQNSSHNLNSIEPPLQKHSQISRLNAQSKEVNQPKCNPSKSDELNVQEKKSKDNLKLPSVLKQSTKNKNFRYQVNTTKLNDSEQVNQEWFEIYEQALQNKSKAKKINLNKYIAEINTLPRYPLPMPEDLHDRIKINFPEKIIIRKLTHKVPLKHTKADPWFKDVKHMTALLHTNTVAFNKLEKQVTRALLERNLNKSTCKSKAKNLHSNTLKNLANVTYSMNCSQLASRQQNVKAVANANKSVMSLQKLPQQEKVADYLKAMELKISVSLHNTQKRSNKNKKVSVNELLIEVANAVLKSKNKPKDDFNYFKKRLNIKTLLNTSDSIDTIKLSAKAQPFTKSNPHKPISAKTFKLLKQNKSVTSNSVKLTTDVEKSISAQAKSSTQTKTLETMDLDDVKERKNLLEINQRVFDSIEKQMRTIKLINKIKADMEIQQPQDKGVPNSKTIKLDQTEKQKVAKKQIEDELCEKASAQEMSETIENGKMEHNADTQSCSKLVKQAVESIVKLSETEITEKQSCNPILVTKERPNVNNLMKEKPSHSKKPTKISGNLKQSYNTKLATVQPTIKIAETHKKSSINKPVQKITEPPENPTVTKTQLSGTKLVLDEATTTANLKKRITKEQQSCNKLAKQAVKSPDKAVVEKQSFIPIRIVEKQPCNKKVGKIAELATDQARRERPKTSTKLEQKQPCSQKLILNQTAKEEPKKHIIEEKQSPSKKLAQAQAKPIATKQTEKVILDQSAKGKSYKTPVMNENQSIGAQATKIIENNLKESTKQQTELLATPALQTGKKIQTLETEVKASKKQLTTTSIPDNIKTQSPADKSNTNLIQKQKIENNSATIAKQLVVPECTVREESQTEVLSRLSEQSTETTSSENSTSYTPTTKEVTVNIKPNEKLEETTSQTNNQKDQQTWGKYLFKRLPLHFKKNTDTTVLPIGTFWNIYPKSPITCKYLERQAKSKFFIKQYKYVTKEVVTTYGEKIKITCLVPDLDELNY